MFQPELHRTAQQAAVALLLAILSLLFQGVTAAAERLQVDHLPYGMHGLYGSVLKNADAALDLQGAMRLQQDGAFLPANAPGLSFGIDNQPVWIRLALHNARPEALGVLVITGTPWIDSLRLSLVHDGQLLDSWQAGDSRGGAAHLVPGIGYVARLSIPPGDSELYLRAQTPDPLVLPLEVLGEDAFEARLLEYRFVYGLIYGFLLSMIVYNSMLYLGMRERSYLYYSIYLGLFALLNFSYSGHGFAWYWADYPTLQNHIILVTMVLFGCSGLLFASSFLSLAGHAPRSRHFLQVLALVGLGCLVASLLLGNQMIEARVAFTFALLSAAGMALLGLTSLRRRRIAGSYYIAATLCGMLGTLISTLTVWGLLPFNGWNYGAIKIGIIFQATLLALALSHKMRLQQSGKLQAERMAQRDPLTGLHNRRGFQEQTAPIWSTVVRNQRPLSLIMLDLDHFKNLNDLHGHAMGDHALVLTARMLEQECRAGDVIARWGGEEFLLLLPETGLADARALAERLRLQIQSLLLAEQPQAPHLSASFGVIERSAQEHLEQLINQADRLLYAAKHTGRNRVCIES